jgi:hypothetical protein
LITGFNTDIKHNEKVYHVQTEDKGQGNPCIESLVYVGGEILASKKTSYADRLSEGADDKTIAQLMELQHKTIIAAVKRGRFDKVHDTVQAKTVAQPNAETVVPIEEEKTLDQVILDYLASEAESEHLELDLIDPVDFIAGQSFELRVTAQRSLSQQPIEGATIEVKVISTVEPPRVIFRGKTDAEGSAVVRSVVPMFNEGTAAVIVSAQSDLGNDELKQLVKRKK